MSLVIKHHLVAIVLLQCAMAFVAWPAEAEPLRWFVLGTPGRLGAEGDRRLPRIHRRGDRSVWAYADVEQTEDGTWLRHEVEGYARVACAARRARGCPPEVREVLGSGVLYVARGLLAEVVWVSGGDTAVRVGWRRVVHCVEGTMTVDAPPLDFLASVLADFPSDLPAPADHEVAEGAWVRDEVNRLLHYAGQAEARMPVTSDAAEQRRLLAFVEGNLALIGELRAAHFGGPSFGDALVLRGAEALQPAPTSDTVRRQLEERIEAVRAWWRGTGPQTSDESAELLCRWRSASAPPR